MSFWTGETFYSWT